MVEKQTISPHEITRVAYAAHPSSYNRGDSKAGIKKHQEIQNKIKTYTQGLAQELRTELTTKTEALQEKEIAQGLYLRAYLDLLISTPEKHSQLVIEIKPSPRKTHFAQLAFNCLALSSNHPGKIYAALYCYKDKSLYQFKNVSNIPWENLSTSAKLAHSLLSNQEQIDALKSSPPSYSVGLQQSLPGLGLNHPDKSSTENQIAQLSNTNIKTRKTFKPLFFQLAKNLTNQTLKLPPQNLENQIKNFLA